MAGETESGAWTIDLDGEGPVNPVQVNCLMGEMVNGQKYGVTQIDHNLRPKTVVRKGKDLVDLKKIIRYR